MSVVQQWKALEMAVAGEQAGGESMLLLGLWTRLELWSYLGAPTEVHIHSPKRAIARVHS